MNEDMKRQTIMERLSKDPFAAAELYGQPGDKDICEPLVRALEDTEGKVRRAAIEALVALNDLYAASSISWTIRHGSDHARLAATEVLGRLPEPSSIPCLVECLQDPVVEIRALAIDALLEIDCCIPKYDEHEEDIVQAVLLLLEHKEEYVREAAVEVLIQSNKPVAFLYLADILIFGSPVAAAAAGKIMKALQPPQSLWALLPDLFIGNKTQRKAAMENTGNHDASLAGKYLLPLLGDDDGDIRLAAATHLDKSGQSEWLTWIKGDHEDFMRLANSGNERAVTPLIRALASTDEALRKIALDGLVGMKRPGLVEALLQPFMLNPWEIRIPLAEVLGARREPEAIDCLAAIAARADASEAVRIACVRALGAISDSRAVDSLNKILKKVDGEIRRAVLEMLNQN
jgi:HEAT repeat protein